MLWPLREQLQPLLGVTVAHRLHKVRVLGAAVRTRHRMTVVAVVVQPLVRVQQQFEAGIALEWQEMANGNGLDKLTDIIHDIRSCGMMPVQCAKHRNNYNRILDSADP